MLEPMLGMVGLGGWEIVLIIMVTLFCVFVVPVAGIVAIIWGIVYLTGRSSKTKPPQPAPIAPATAAPTIRVAADSPLAAQGQPIITKTEVMPRKCPQCGTALQSDAPEGLCPACLLQRGFATEAGASPDKTAFVPPAIDELTKLFPQLEILECLGRGGMGAVYKARQPRLDRLVALKIIAQEKQNDPQFAERFEREARVLAKLNHPNIVSVYEFGEVQGRYYLIMEFVDGLTLRQVMQAGKISPPEALNLVPKICEALQYAHEQGIVHRDIKPENILLDKQGHLKIADFGIAKIAGVEAKGLSLTGVRDVMGTPNYMAPEQVEKPQSVDHRADIYSLGVVFYEMLTGELPLGKFPPPSKKVQMDVRLDEVVLHALEKEPARRYQHASQVKTAVENIAGTPPPFAQNPVAAAAGNLVASSGIITAPAVALMVAGLWKLLKGLTGLMFFVPSSSWLNQVIGEDVIGNWKWAIVPNLILFSVVPAALMIYGGYQMLQRRSYAWAMAAGIISVVACSLIGLPVGIWALVVLARDDVKAAFGGNPIASPISTKPNGFWRSFAIVAGCLLLIPLVIIFIVALAFIFKAEAKSSGGQTQTQAAAGLPRQFQVAALSLENGEYRTNFTQTIPLNADGRFSVDNVNGRTEIHGWNSNVVVLKTSIHGKSPESVTAVRININSDPNHFAVHTELPSNSGLSSLWDLFKNGLQDKATVDYTAQVPQNARLKDVDSVNGSIAIDGVLGDITSSTVNGETQIKGASKNLKISTVNGTVTAQMNSMGSGQSVSFDAVNGQLNLAVPENADATFSVTTVNGDISSEFPSLKAKHQWPVGNNLNGSLGTGAGSVKVNAVNGTIKFIKSQTSKPGTNDPPSLAGGK